MTEIESETQLTILFWNQQNWTRPFSIDRFNHARVELILDLLSDLLVFVRPGTVWLLRNWLGPWLEVYPVICPLYLPDFPIKDTMMLL